MTTSGNTSWELNRDTLIAAAYRKIGIPGEDNTLSTTQVTDGMPLWKRTTAQETPSTTSQVYTLADAIKIAGVFLRDSGGVQYDLKNKSEYDFMRLPRNSIGVPVHYMWQPSIQGGTVSIWPLTSDASTVSTKTLQIVYQKEFDGFTASTETLDFPAYWTLAIVYKLALLLAPEYGVPITDRQILAKEAKEFWDLAASYGDEDGGFYVQPSRRY
jgi:hypothetical protein